MKKLDGYPHNGYLTDMDTSTERIFIQRVGYGGATTRTLPIPLTSLVIVNNYLNVVTTSLLMDIYFSYDLLLLFYFHSFSFYYHCLMLIAFAITKKDHLH